MHQKWSGLILRGSWLLIILLEKTNQLIEKPSIKQWLTCLWEQMLRNILHNHLFVSFQGVASTSLKTIKLNSRFFFCHDGTQFDSQQQKMRSNLFQVVSSVLICSFNLQLLFMGTGLLQRHKGDTGNTMLQKKKKETSKHFGFKRNQPGGT